MLLLLLVVLLTGGDERPIRRPRQTLGGAVQLISAEAGSSICEPLVSIRTSE
jgi:hypothetical protein